MRADRGPWADAAQHAGVDATLLAGDHLLHTDLNPHNILVTDSAVRIVDWSWPTLGAAWLDTACAALWLIAEGHSPADAELWAAKIPAWADAPGKRTRRVRRDQRRTLGRDRLSRPTPLEATPVSSYDGVV